MTSSYSGPAKSALKNPLSSRAIRFAVQLSILCLGFIGVTTMAGCATRTQGIEIGNSAPPPNPIDINKVVCSPWRAITYSNKKDTKETVDQVRVHNQVGQRLQCWK